MRPEHFPVLALPVRCQDKRALTCSSQYSYSAHLLKLLTADCADQGRICSKSSFNGYRPSLRLNSVPEFRRCEVTLTSYGFVHEEFKFSYRSSCDRDRSDGTADGREWRTRPRDGRRKLAEWFSLSPLSAMGPSRRAHDSFSLCRHSRGSPVFGKRTDLCTCRTLRALWRHGRIPG